LKDGWGDGDGTRHKAEVGSREVLVRFEEAKRGDGLALEMFKDERVAVGLKLTEEVIATLAKQGQANGKVAPFGGGNRAGRKVKAFAIGKALGLR
jgi:hypothetical protein